jgi:hypothetical protein
MSWGNKLVLVFVAFVALMATLVYKAINTKFELVTKDYYKEELRYQDKIDGAANAKLAGAILLLQDAATVTVQLPVSLRSSTAQGDAWFYCKTDAAKDLRIPVTIEEGQYSFDKASLAKGSYQLKLQLTSGEKQYYYKEYITVQ